MVSLLAFDFTIAFLPREWDIFTLIIVALVFLFFCVEVGLAGLADRTYVCTFFCLLDVIGALSLIPDMLELVEGMGILQDSSVSCVLSCYNY